MKSLQDYSRKWRGGDDCACQAHRFDNYDPLGDDPMHFSDLPEAERDILLGWIARCIHPRKTVCLRHNSYGLKHIYESDTGNYITNGQFKGAMITAGYAPHDAAALNPCYSIGGKVGGKP